MYLAIVNRWLEKFGNWDYNPGSEESFIDQHIIMFLGNIFGNDDRSKSIIRYAISR
jgi:hypothetical protein